MCSEYWSLAVNYDCPLCGSNEAGELQTHWMGGSAFSLKAYELGARLPHLRGIEAATVGADSSEGFISTCRNCGGSVEWAARIEQESVVRVWPKRVDHP